MSLLLIRRIFRYGAYLLSTYLVFIITCKILDTIHMLTYQKETKERKCSAGEEFNLSYDPDYFYHLTDIHISTPPTINNYQNALEIGKKINSDLLLITGDLTNSLPMRVSQQNPKDWYYYNQTTEKYAPYFKNIIE